MKWCGCVIRASNLSIITRRGTTLSKIRSIGQNELWVGNVTEWTGRSFIEIGTQPRHVAGAGQLHCCPMTKHDHICDDYDDDSENILYNSVHN